MVIITIFYILFLMILFRFTKFRPLLSLLSLVFRCFYSFFLIYRAGKFTNAGFLILLCVLGGVAIVFSFMLLEVLFSHTSSFRGIFILLRVCIVLFFICLEVEFFNMFLFGDMMVSTLFVVFFLLNLCLMGLNISLSYSNFKMKKI